LKDFKNKFNKSKQILKHGRML